MWWRRVRFVASGLICGWASFTGVLTGNWWALACAALAALWQWDRPGDDA